MKICVLGAGSLGSAMGGLLSEAGHEVWLINRNPAHVDVIRAKGLTLREDGVDRVVRVHAATCCADVDVQTSAVDLMLVLVKSFHTREAIASASAILGPDTVVLSLQNGLGHEDILAEVVGAQRLLAGKSYVGGQVFAPGQVIVGAKGKDTHIGELDGQVTARVMRIAQAFSDAGLQTHVSDNIMGTIWDKLLVNVATGALSGITRLPYGEMYQQPDVEACAVAAVAEAMAVARAHGIALSVTDPRQPWLKAGAGLPYEFKASMLQSLEKGSITEVDFVNGSVVRWGQKVGVPTPVNQTLVACIKGIEHGLFHSAEAKKRATKSH